MHVFAAYGLADSRSVARVMATIEISERKGCPRPVRNAHWPRWLVCVSGLEVAALACLWHSSPLESAEKLAKAARSARAPRAPRGTAETGRRRAGPGAAAVGPRIGSTIKIHLIFEPETVRHHRRHSHRLAAPGRLAATGASSRSEHEERRIVENGENGRLK